MSIFFRKSTYFYLFVLNVSFLKVVSAVLPSGEVQEQTAETLASAVSASASHVADAGCAPMETQESRPQKRNADALCAAGSVFKKPFADADFRHFVAELAAQQNKARTAAIRADATACRLDTVIQNIESWCTQPTQRNFACVVGAENAASWYTICQEMRAWGANYVRCADYLVHVRHIISAQLQSPVFSVPQVIAHIQGDGQVLFALRFTRDAFLREEAWSMGMQEALGDTLPFATDASFDMSSDSAALDCQPAAKKRRSDEGTREDVAPSASLCASESFPSAPVTPIPTLPTELWTHILSFVFAPNEAIRDKGHKTLCRLSAEEQQDLFALRLVSRQFYDAVNSLRVECMAPTTWCDLIHGMQNGRIRPNCNPTFSYELGLSFFHFNPAPKLHKTFKSNDWMAQKVRGLVLDDMAHVLRAECWAPIKNAFPHIRSLRIAKTNPPQHSSLVVDLSGFKHLTHLEMSNCPDVERIIGSPSLLSIKVNECTGLTTIAAHKNLQTLEAIECEALEHIDDLPLVRRMMLTDHFDTAGIPHKDKANPPVFPCLKTLILEGCINVASVGNLPIEDLTATECALLKRIENLCQIEKINLQDCPVFETFDLGAQNLLEKLHIERCPLVTMRNLDAPKLRDLMLVSCPGVLSLSSDIVGGLPALTYIGITDCKNLHSIKGFDSLRTLDFSCEQDVEPVCLQDLRKLEELYIEHGGFKQMNQAARLSCVAKKILPRLLFDDPLPRLEYIFVYDPHAAEQGICVTLTADDLPQHMHTYFPKIYTVDEDSSALSQDE